MGIYFTKESENPFLNSTKNVVKDKRKLSIFLPLYIGIGATFILLCLLSILIPIWLKDLAELEKLVDQEFSGIRVKSESAWRELLQIESDDPTVSWARIRRQTSDEFSNYDYRPDPNTLSNNEAEYDGSSGNNQRKSLYPAEPVSSSYNNYDNYREQKCCCDLQAIVASGNIDQLPVLSQCRTGVKGPPGQKGPVGEAGYDGRPGKPGLDFSFYAAGGDFNGPHTVAAYPSDDPYAATVINPYPSPPSSSPRYCEPCPPGRPGPEGPKGRPGNPGMKGMEGASGKHGLPGRAGNRGPSGDMGPRGRHGYGGIPGPNGADGIKGAIGAPGTKGQQGDTGLSGIRGPQGPDGSPGYIGRVGIRGPRGIKGQRGLDGIDGPPGRPGAPGDDGFYCACPPRTSAAFAGNDDYQNFNPQRPSSGINSFSQPPRPPPAVVVPPPSPPAIQPIVQRPVYGNRQNPNEYTRKIYVNDPSDQIPIAPRREFNSNNNNNNHRKISTNIHSPFVTQSSPQFEDNNNHAFVGRSVFTTNRPPTRTWQTTNEEQTYGLDEDFINPRTKILHRHHQIA